MKNSNKVTDKRFVKYSANLKGSIPSSVKIFTDHSYVSDELAMAELINDADCIEGNMVVFDRGFQSRNSFDKFSAKHKSFITDANPTLRCKVVSQNKINPKPVNSSVSITSDEVGLLINKKEKYTQCQYRVIKGTIDDSGDKIYFITNILKEDIYLIAAWYRQRWEIEVFFKFIKQHLNVKNLVSRDENGMKVMILQEQNICSIQAKRFRTLMVIDLYQ